MNQDQALFHKTDQLNLYNTASKSVEAFRPLQRGKVSLYACGLTVYDYTHLGHLRKYTLDDILIRVLKSLGYKVKFVQNVTDVGHLASDADTGEDKLEKGAKKYGQSVWDVAKKFEDYFFYSMDLMGNLRPDVSCRATEHIEQQLQMVLELEKKGYTYVIDDDGVYFDTSKFIEYGKMAGLNVDDQQAGARVSAEGKKNPADFALWKFEREGENRAMVWPSPWSERSFPGWHIECSAMARQYLGDQFDIHTGGVDHIAVHHTNEIAQTEALTDKKPFVNYWVHHNFLQIDGEKMSKSLGNFYTIDDVIQKGFAPTALRVLFLSAHYRSQMNFTWENLQASQIGLVRLQQKVIEIKQSISNSDSERDDVKNKLKKITKISQNATKLHDKFLLCLYDDLNTPRALAVMWEVLKSKLSDLEKLDLLVKFDQILAIGLTDLIIKNKFLVKVSSQNEDELDFSENFNQDLSLEIEKLLTQRKVAKSEKNFQVADELRAKIADLGFEVIDAQNEQKLIRKKR